MSITVWHVAALPFCAVAAVLTVHGIINTCKHKPGDGVFCLVMAGAALYIAAKIVS